MSIASITKSTQIQTTQAGSLTQSSDSSALSNSTGTASATSTSGASGASVSTTSTDVTRLQNEAKTLQSEILNLQGSHGSANRISKLQNTLSDVQKRIQQLAKQQTRPSDQTAEATEKSGTEPSENTAGSSNSLKFSLNSNVGTAMDTQA